MRNGVVSPSKTRLVQVGLSSCSPKRVPDKNPQNANGSLRQRVSVGLLELPLCLLVTRKRSFHVGRRKVDLFF